jgi:hypothetical protein
MALATESQSLSQRHLSATHSTQAGPVTGWQLAAWPMPNSELANKRNIATVT